MQVQELILNIKQKRKFRGPRTPRRLQIGFHKLDKVRNLLKDEDELEDEDDTDFGTTNDSDDDDERG